MSRTISVKAQIEILASPTVVRSVFLGFDRYQQWQQGWDIRPADTTKKPLELKSGDKIRVSMHGMVFNPEVITNDPECFTWEGSIPWIVKGRHYFSFYPSKENPGGTTFIQSEDYSGGFVTLFGSWVKTDQPNENWNAFNAALKKEAERCMSSS
ncbi:hypothetical protein CEP54_002948 [Fusarium duplospermum]|uniref:Polyketide cyclase n=1 Tax=Fusarium duplospermum TaxID=1325734 RepID=A0A428QRZ2_9HYPO|nr:hypothetical protein CEP54_002948 [Fusarium duplospermum]